MEERGKVLMIRTGELPENRTERKSIQGVYVGDELKAFSRVADRVGIHVIKGSRWVGRTISHFPFDDDPDKR